MCIERSAAVILGSVLLSCPALNGHAPIHDWSWSCDSLTRFSSSSDSNGTYITSSIRNQSMNAITS